MVTIGEFRRQLAQRPELRAWLDGLGIDSKVTYRLEITIPAGKQATMAVYQYDQNEDGAFHTIWTNGAREVVVREPFTITIDTLPGVPALEGGEQG